MAIPPEPLQELLPHATHIVDAEVLEVVSQGPTPPTPPHAQGATSVPSRTPSQVVKLRIKRALKGGVTGELTVDKPEGDYVLSRGNHGPFLLKAAAKGNPVILGRYGPDTYRLSTLEAALKA
jgi:hypothetical protein